MDLPRESEFPADLSPLAWVQEELRRSLEAAHKALRRYQRDADAPRLPGQDVLDTSGLNSARQQVHQAAGVMALVGLPAGATMLRACEAGLQALIDKPERIRLDAIETLERADFALLDYVARLLAGRPVSSLSLFPQYRAAQALAGADRVHPADLWTHEWSWQELPDEPGITPRKPETARSAFETTLLKFMREGSAEGARNVSELCASMGAGATTAAARTLWHLAAGFFEAQGLGLLQPDAFGKRVGSRLLAQLRGGASQDAAAAERLARDLLFFCAQSAPPPRPGAAPRLQTVREAFGLAEHQPVDYEEVRLGQVDPAWVTQARKRVSVAKDAWSSVAEGDMQRLVGMDELFALVAESLQKLFPRGEVLGHTLQRAVVGTARSGAAPTSALAMEVATAMLYVDAALEDAAFDAPEQAERVQRLAQRVDSVAHGDPPQPLESWMEDLYRRVSDRQTMGSVVQELRHSLSETEKLVDDYFRDTSKREVLIPVPGQMSAMRGVLTVLGMEQAAQAVLRMRDQVDELMNTEVDATRQGPREIFERLAGNLGALGFLIDMLSVQPHLAKRLFRFDEETGVLSPVMGRREAESTGFSGLDDLPPVATYLLNTQPMELQAVRPEPLATDIDLGEFTLDLAPTQIQVRQHEPEPVVAPAPAAAPMPVLTTQANDAEIDAEMLEVFLEECHEVVATARDALAQLHQDPGDQNQLTTVRRAFHTLKGSSRMVGLLDFGEAGWACEQLYNARLGDLRPADAPLLAFSGEALDYLFDWSEAISHGRSGGHHSASVRRPADALRLEGRVEHIEWPNAVVAPEVQELPEPAAAPALVEQPALVEPELVELAALPDLELPAFELPAVELQAVDLAPAELPHAVMDLPELVLDGEEAEAQAASLEPAELAAPVPQLDGQLDQQPDFASDQTLPMSTATELPLDADDFLDLPEFGFEAPAMAPVPVFPEAASLDSSELPAFELALDFGEAAPVERVETATEPIADPFADLVADEAPLPLEAEQPLSDAEIALGQPITEDLPPAEPELPLDLASGPEPVAPAEVLPPSRPHLELVHSADAVAAQEEAALAAAEEAEAVKVIGPLRISIALFNIFLNEADEQSRRLSVELAEWTLELNQPLPESAIALAHSLAGNAATVGFEDLSQLARLLEHALTRTRALEHGTPEEGQLFVEAADEIRRLLHQFAAGFLKQPDAGLNQRLAEHEHHAAERLQDQTLHDKLPELDLSSEAMPLVDLAEDAHAAPVDDEALAAVAADALAGLDEQPEPADVTEVADTVVDSLGEPVVEVPAAEPEEVIAEAPSQAVEALAGADEPEAAASEFAPLSQLAELGRVDHLGHLGEVSTGPLQPASPVAGESHAPAGRGHAQDDLDVADLDAEDAIDAELFPIFEEEGIELLEQLAARMRDWAAQPSDMSQAAACMRNLHTLKGGARLAGAMRLGEMAHRMESVIESLLSQGSAAVPDIERLQTHVDAMSSVFEVLRNPQAVAAPAPRPEPTLILPVLVEAVGTPPAAAPAQLSEPEPEPEPEPVVAAEPAPVSPEPVAQAAPVPVARPEPARIDWSQFSTSAAVSPKAPAERVAGAAHGLVRVRAPLLERLINQAGEVSIRRSRMESEVAQMKGSLNDLNDNLERLRQQLRDMEFQADAQINSRLEHAKHVSEDFDPLEFDRYTRVQELTRIMAESVGDVATVQRTLQRALQAAEDELAAQARLTRDLQDDLLSTRMVEFDSLSDRLYRVLRQAAKETGKQVRLDVQGGSIEVDRGVLERMTAAFEHLLRNSVIHGIEMPEQRTAAGKDATGNIVVALTHEGNEVAVEFRDDGAGLNLERIRHRGVQMGLIAEGANPSDAELTQLIFMHGFSTATALTELAGRGVGMDVVRDDVNAMGGRIASATTPGQGTSFKLLLPLTTAVTQVVMLRCGENVVAVPATLIERVLRGTLAEVEAAYRSGSFSFNNEVLPFFWLGGLLQQGGGAAAPTGRTQPLVVVKSAQQRVALHVDEVIGNQEVVVKNLGPQLVRVPGLAGITLLASGAAALIYNPVALATLYGDKARQLAAAAAAQAQLPQQPEARSGSGQAPLVMVVDDSLTVRRVTQRLLEREGYRVALAKDGLDALERLADELPALVLSDIEMPRMDGFDLVRNMHADARLRELPVIMITSRIAQKHRDYASELGVQHYLGKPYDEEELLSLIGRYTSRQSKKQAAGL